MASPSASPSLFDPHNVNLDTASARDIACYQQLSAQNAYSGDLGARVSALFVILLVSTLMTLFPVAAGRVRWVRVPLGAYLFARYVWAFVFGRVVTRGCEMGTARRRKQD